MMVVGDNLGKKKEKIEEAAQLGKPTSASSSHHNDHPCTDEHSFLFLTKRPDHHVKSCFSLTVACVERVT